MRKHLMCLSHAVQHRQCYCVHCCRLVGCRLTVATWLFAFGSGRLVCALVAAVRLLQFGWSGSVACLSSLGSSVCRCVRFRRVRVTPRDSLCGGFLEWTSLPMKFSCKSQWLGKNNSFFGSTF